MKRFLSTFLIALITIIMIVGCTNKVEDSNSTNPSSNNNSFDTNRTINVITREEGSGTRGAFVEIVGILEKDENGNENDRTYSEAIVQNSTNAVMTTVAGDEYSIGYISLGSLNNSVKAVKVDGIEATAENILNGSYKVARPFNLAYKGDLTPLTQDFLNFILSAEGQEIVANEGYVQVDTQAPNYEANSLQSGTIVVAGSTSVTPLMEKFVEAYQKLNPDVSIEIQSTGSSAGMQSAMEGTANIGMASRELKESELKELKNVVVALDGIAIIVNNNNPTDNLSIDQIKSIYMGEITNWNEIE
ncbi:substrate-binding domain-containing protein [Tepidimicrobium xylanilyticum]|uniref:Phosphate ABC transporter substrate-binding protein, PhoT family (TC 3.A.1.7.1) n=1 Tax=Tepidimicrobium xylanilyticum TaxID=1123352 RepID=A0A1H3CEG6_9FIRM|nr:substrate-binding domain-containing protein [Tepidimicrobium xylanilyticum]SDX52420.1 phosphate ABC transporter substrate-binding protein, PhoT family (TC 3.A.1.7.1) [Tepidimicrobium xylanilyticum]